MNQSVDNLLDWLPLFFKKAYPLRQQVLPAKTPLRLVSYTPSNVHGCIIWQNFILVDKALT